MLPQSHVLPTSHLNVYERPIAARGPYDVYEASLDGAKVWVKRLRIYSTAGVGDVTRVCLRDFHLHSFVSHQPVGFLPGSYYMETSVPSKHCPPPGRYSLALPIRVGLGLGWRVAGLHILAPARRSAWSRTWRPQIHQFHTHPLQLSDVADGLNYLHSRNITHGDLKGVRTLTKRPPSVSTDPVARRVLSWTPRVSHG